LILKNSNRFYLNVPAEPNNWLHLATLQEGVREFCCFCDKITGQVYIEEMVGGHFERIEDDFLAESIAEFLKDNKVLDVSRPTLPDYQWLKGL
jgi:hypothetical protein